jgi:hypothetical protein
MQPVAARRWSGSSPGLPGRGRCKSDNHQWSWCVRESSQPTTALPCTTAQAVFGCVLLAGLEGVCSCSAQVGQVKDAGTHPQLAEGAGGFVALVGQDHRTGFAGHGDQARANHPGQHPAQLPLGGFRVNCIPVQAVVDRLHMAGHIVERLDGDANGSRLHEVLRQVFRQQVGGAFHGL